MCNSILFTLYRDILQIEQGCTFCAELNEVRSIKRLPFFQAQSGPFNLSNLFLNVKENEAIYYHCRTCRHGGCSNTLCPCYYFQ